MPEGNARKPLRNAMVRIPTAWLPPAAWRLTETAQEGARPEWWTEVPFLRCRITSQYDPKIFVDANSIDCMVNFKNGSVQGIRAMPPFGTSTKGAPWMNAPATPDPLSTEIPF